MCELVLKVDYKRLLVFGDDGVIPTCIVLITVNIWGI